LLAILDVTIPFFALVLCGFLAAWRRKLPQQTVAALNGFVLYFALPAMLFRFAVGAPFADVVDPGVFFSYALTGLAVLFGVAHGLRRFRGDRWDDAAYGAMATAWANWGYMGIALVPALLGPAAMAPLIAAGMADLLVVVSASLAIASRSDTSDEHWLRAAWGALAGIARNPLIWAVVAGLVVNGFAIRLPTAFDEFLRLLGTAAGPVALFSIGVSLYRPGGVRIGVDTWALTLAKLFVHPALAWAIGTWVFRLDPAQAMVLMLMAALPAAGSAFLFAERGGADADRIAAVILVSTAMAFGTFSVFASLATG